MMSSAWNVNLPQKNDEIGISRTDLTRLSPALRVKTMLPSERARIYRQTQRTLHAAGLLTHKKASKNKSPKHSGSTSNLQNEPNSDIRLFKEWFQLPPSPKRKRNKNIRSSSKQQNDSPIPADTEGIMMHTLENPSRRLVTTSNLTITIEENVEENAEETGNLKTCSRKKSISEPDSLHMHDLITQEQNQKPMTANEAAEVAGIQVELYEKPSALQSTSTQKSQPKVRKEKGVFRRFGSWTLRKLLCTRKRNN